MGNRKCVQIIWDGAAVPAEQAEGHQFMTRPRATAEKIRATHQTRTIKTQSVFKASLSAKLFVCLMPALQPEPQKNCFNDKILPPK